MSYFIRRLEGGTVTFWRGPAQPDAWVYHASDAAQFATIGVAQDVFRLATGYSTGGSVLTVGGRL